MRGFVTIIIDTEFKTPGSSYTLSKEVVQAKSNDSDFLGEGIGPRKRRLRHMDELDFVS